MTIPISQVLTDLEDLQARVTLDPTYAPEHVAALRLAYHDYLDADLEGLQVQSTDRFCSLCGDPLWDPHSGPWCGECEERETAHSMSHPV